MVQVMLSGRLVKDPEIITTTANNKQFLQFTLAAPIPEKGEDGRYKANFFVCKIFGERGMVLSKFLAKGDPIAVVGRMKELFFNKKDGTSGHILEVVVEDFDWNGKRATAKVTSAKPQTESFAAFVPGEDNLNF